MQEGKGKTTKFTFLSWGMEGNNTKYAFLPRGMQGITTKSAFLSGGREGKTTKYTFHSSGMEGTTNVICPSPPAHCPIGKPFAPHGGASARVADAGRYARVGLCAPHPTIRLFSSFTIHF